LDRKTSGVNSASWAAEHSAGSGRVFNYPKHLDPNNLVIPEPVRSPAGPKKRPDTGLCAPAVNAATAEQRRIRVLVIIPALCVGGAETDLVRNLPLVDRSRFEIVVCTFLERGTLSSQLTAAGIKIVGPFSHARKRWFWVLRVIRRHLKRLATEWNPKSPPARWLKKLAGNLVSTTDPIIAFAIGYAACVRPVAQVVRAGNFDLVHTVLPYSYAFGAWANRLAGSKPLIMSRLALNWHQDSDRLIGWLERRVLHPRLDAAICNSDAIARELEAEGIPRSKIRVIYNGIDVPAYSKLQVARSAARTQLGVGHDDLVFSSVANLFTYKGHADLLRALHKIAGRLPRAWTLLVAGRDIDGNRARLIELRNQLGLALNIRFLGERSDVPIIYSAADIHVSASHTEGLPNNILEAMCCRLPVVATAVGGVPELVVDGATGLLVPPRDVNALGDALLALANDSESRARMGTAGHERVAVGFSIQRSVERFEQIYRDMGVQRVEPHVSGWSSDKNRPLRSRSVSSRQPKSETRGIVVMMHEVNDGPENYARELATGLTARSLESIVTLLRGERWDIVTIEEALLRLNRNDSENRFAVLTFDDGYRDTLTRALPILERHEAPFTVYIPTGAPTRNVYSWWLGLRALFQRNDRINIDGMEASFECHYYEDKIEGLQRALAWVRANHRRVALLDDTFRRYGITLAELNETYFMNESELCTLAGHRLASIGAHTVSHSALSLLSHAAVREEFASNRQYLEGLLDCRVADLAYPYGDPSSCGEREFALAAEAGFRSAVTTCYGPVLARHRRSTCELPRVAAGVNVDFDKFATAVMTL
jgi:glycosyltransferase involved in cell wall biosynthesis/peptidoglycan/xylan/chitin deacetylase (PgdA/CDA1 family)